MIKQKFPCGICLKNVRESQPSILCNNCNFYVHITCSEVSPSEYKTLADEPDEVPCFCKKCTIADRESIFPFGTVENEILSDLFELDKPSVVDSLPSFEITSHLTNLPNLQDYDIDEQLPSNIDSNYVSIQDLSSTDTNHTDLSFLHMNIRSLSCHFDELQTLLVNLKVPFDVVAVSETWDSFKRPLKVNVEIPGYTFFSTRSQSQNGGVGLYIKSSLAPIPRSDLASDSDDFETVWTEVENPKDKNILICCAYRHPNSDPETFNEYIQNILANPTITNKNVFILGDFNLNLLNYDSHTPTKNFVSLFLSQHFLPFVVHPTRVSDHSSTIIDNIFSNICNLETKSGNILTHIADHFPQFLIVKKAGISNRTLSFYQHDYSKFNQESFLEDFNNLNFEYLNENINDVNTKFNKFLDNLNDIVKKHAPLKKLTKKELKFRNKPWINSRIQKMMRLRDKALKKLRKKPDEATKLLYKQFRNRIAIELKESKKNYFHNYFNVNSNNMKLLWTGIKSIISLKNSHVNIINKIKDENGNLTTDSSKMANIFNDFFVNVADNITKKIPRSKKSPMDYLSNKNSHSVFISPSVPYEISDIIDQFKTGKSIGPNSIPMKLFKILSPYVSSPLSLIINESFQTGVFPTKMKQAKVIPLFKKGCSVTSSNYRPISLLSVFSKIIEKLMYKRLYNFLELHEVLYNLQFGFRASHSIDHALISLTESIKNTLDNKKYGCGIFIDLQKAFDIVNHKILLSKLEHYGIRGTALAWFSSYLYNRSQYVSVNGHNSNCLNITCGVPQGSVLGPLLFLIYINDLPNSSTKLTFYLFADDTNIYYESECLFKLQKVVNKELKLVKKWLDANKLALNVEKTNFIIFHSQKNLLHETVNIKIGKKHVKQVKYVKFLGLLLDENLTWKYHLNELSKKLARTSGVFFKIRHLHPSNVLVSLYHSLFGSFIQYGIVVWGLTYDIHTKPIYILQKKVVRAITFNNFAAPSTPIFSELKILKLYDLFYLKLLSFVFECVNKISPSYFHDYFTLLSSVHQYDTRQARMGSIFLNRRNTLQYGIRSVRYTGAKFWNELPSIIKQCPSKLRFHQQLKVHLFSTKY